jgi:hypothetical protein
MKYQIFTAYPLGGLSNHPMSLRVCSLKTAETNEGPVRIGLFE